MRKRLKNNNVRKSGQAIIFLIMVLFIGTIVVLWNFDLHNIVSTKIRIDNAGDAAALSAARWQGITLNMIGELNLVQAAYVCDQMAELDASSLTQQELESAIEDLELDINGDSGVADLKRRMALIGPLMGMVSAQASALLNLTEKDKLLIEEASSRFMAERGQDFENSGGYYQDEVQEPYPGAWEEYGAILSSIASQDMIAEAGNTEYFLFFDDNHPLLNPSFYEDIRGPDLCSMARRWKTYLETFEDYTSWPPLPDLVERSTVNSEYFSSKVYEWGYGVSISLYYSATNWHVAMLTNYFDDVETTPEDLKEDLIYSYMANTGPTDGVDLDMLNYYEHMLDLSWHFFQMADERNENMVWDQNGWLYRHNGYESRKYMPDSEDFPFHEGTKFRDEYNYGGANSAVDIRISSDIYTPGLQLAVGDIYWQAAAKPFGYLDNPDNPGNADDRVTPVYYGIVLPAFRDARLIHNELSSRNSSITSADWDEHMYTHVEEYLKYGLPAIESNDCYYCDIIELWENDEHREAILEWVEENQEAIDNGDMCRPKGGNPNMGRG